MSYLTRSSRKKFHIWRIGPKRICALVGIAAFVFLVWRFYREGVLNPSIIQHFNAVHPILAIALFVVFYATCVIASLPSLPLNLAAGFFWGGLVGGIYTTIGVTLGSWVSFSAARWLVGQPLANRFENKWINKVQVEFERDGWKFVAFARLNPIIPTGPLNYLLGLTSLSNKSFLGTTFVFLLPLSILVAYIGDSLQTFTLQGSDISEKMTAALCISAAVTILASLKFAFGFLKKSNV